MVAYVDNVFTILVLPRTPITKVCNFSDHTISALQVLYKVALKKVHSYCVVDSALRYYFNCDGKELQHGSLVFIKSNKTKTSPGCKASFLSLRYLDCCLAINSCLDKISSFSTKVSTYSSTRYTTVSSCDRSVVVHCLY